MTTIVGVAGSLRRHSFNRALLDCARELAPEGVDVQVAGIDGIPLYDADRETEEGVPPAVVALKDRIAAADGLLLASPEYNGSLPGTLKNAIDWLSRPPDDIPRVFRDRPVALLGATPGGLGTLLSQTAWLPVLRTLRMRPWFDGRLMVSGAHKLIAADGAVTDPRTREQIAAFMAGFAAFVRAR